VPIPGSEAKTEARIGAEQANTEPVLDDLDSVDLDAPVAFDLVDPEPRAPVSAASLLVRRIVLARVLVSVLTDMQNFPSQEYSKIEG
jgi:hypothetical protein